MLKPLIRKRSLVLLGGAIIAGVLSYLSDPDGGMATMLGVLSLIQAVWAVTASHWVRKALMDYPEADMQKLFARASETPQGSGLALIAIAIVLFGLLLVFSPRAHATPLPDGFLRYGPVLKVEQEKQWPSHPDPAVLASLVEQESCVSLKSRSCWNPGAKLKTDREEGAGLGQITRAYRKDGSQRFDALADMKTRYSGELGEWTWDNVYQRPDLQLRAIVLTNRDAAKQFREAPAMLAFADAGYNGGVSGVQKERRSCQLTKGCDAGQWFGHVEAHCLKSKTPLYGTRSACDINREHVKNVLLVRKAKYVPFFTKGLT